MVDQKQSNRRRVEDRVLSSNDILSDADKDTARELLTETVDELLALDAEILQLQEALSNLQKRHANIISRVEGLKTGVGPRSHRKLPPELLSKIFGYCNSSPIRFSLEDPENIWAIIQVCSRWREVAIADPHLWSRLQVSGSYVAGKDSSGGIGNLIHDIFSNRGGQSIIQYESRIANQAEWKSLLNLIGTYRSRLQKLIITANYSYTIEKLPIEPPSTGQSLLLADDTSRGILPASPSHGALLWNQLTHLTIRRITIPTFVSILAHCTQLISCEAIFNNRRVTQEISRDPIILEHVHSMAIEHEQSRSVDRFLELLVLPALKNLRLGYLDEWPQEGILKLVTRSNCAIKSFISNGNGPLGDEVVPLMKSMPSLAVLEVYNRTPISELALDTIRLGNLGSKLTSLRGWEIGSMRSFIGLVLSRRQADTNEGMRNVKVRIQAKLYSLDKEYYTEFLSELEKDGQVFEVFTLHY